MKSLNSHILVCAFCGHRYPCFTSRLVWPYSIATDNTQLRPDVPKMHTMGSLQRSSDERVRLNWCKFNNTLRKRHSKEKEGKVDDLHMCVLVLQKSVLKHLQIKDSVMWKAACCFKTIQLASHLQIISSKSFKVDHIS